MLATMKRIIKPRPPRVIMIRFQYNKGELEIGFSAAKVWQYEIYAYWLVAQLLALPLALIVPWGFALIYMFTLSFGVTYMLCKAAGFEFKRY